MSGLSNLTEAKPEATKKTREYKGRICRLIFNSPTLNVNEEVRYQPAKSESIFKPEGIKKTGPNGGELRWERPKAWKVFEKQSDGTEKEISEDDVQYSQDTGEVDGQGNPVTMQVEPFDATKTIDIREDRNLDECNLDGVITLGSVIPDTMESNFGNDKEKGSKIYEIYTLQGGQGLLQVAEKLEKEKVKLFFPFVFRKGMSVHLCVAKIVRLDADVYMVMTTYAGPIKLERAIKAGGVIPQKIVARPVLAKPMLRRKPIGVS